MSNCHGLGEGSAGEGAGFTAGLLTAFVRALEFALELFSSSVVFSPAEELIKARGRILSENGGTTGSSLRSDSIRRLV
jgi:hypothetical protein